MSVDPKIEYGAYLVRHVAGCMECHTPRLPSGAFDESRLLSGVLDVEDLVPEDDARGAIHGRNLTPHRETGVGGWSDQELMDAFMHGRSPQGRILHWTMPYWLYHSMVEEDADAIVAFLRSIPPVEHAVPDRQPLPQEPEQPYHLPYDLFPQSTLPQEHPDRAHADRGRYLATAAGICVYCHTRRSGEPDSPLDLNRLFMGRRQLVPTRLGVPYTEPDAPLIETRNLTPHATGLADWVPKDVAKAVRLGVSKTGLPVCEPMPSTYGGSFLGMKERDALDIGIYLTTIEPRDSGTIQACCSACHGNEQDAGVSP